MSARSVAIPLEVLEMPRPRTGAGIRQAHGQTMGTSWSVRYDPGAGVAHELVLKCIEERLECVVAQMSTWRPGSDILRYNNAAPGSWVNVPDEFMVVLKAALLVSTESAGAFDPACGVLVDLWGFGPAGEADEEPSLEALAFLRQRHGAADLRIDEEARRVFQPGGARLDFSSIAKGFAVDQVGEALRRQGITAWLVDIGGELKGAGFKPAGEPWWVAMDAQATCRKASDNDLVVALIDLAIATSGDGVRFYERDGRRFTHVIDPRTGRPIEHGLAAATVLHESAMLADAYATAILALGPDDGFAFAEGFNLPACLVGRSGRARLTQPLLDMVQR